MNCYFCSGKTTRINLDSFSYFRCPNHKGRVLNWDSSLVDPIDYYWFSKNDLDSFATVDLNLGRNKWVRALWVFDTKKFSMFYLSDPNPFYELDELPNYQPEDIPNLYNRLMKLKSFL